MLVLIKLILYISYDNNYIIENKKKKVDYLAYKNKVSYWKYIFYFIDIIILVKVRSLPSLR